MRGKHHIIKYFEGIKGEAYQGEPNPQWGGILGWKNLERGGNLESVVLKFPRPEYEPYTQVEILSFDYLTEGPFLLKFSHPELLERFLREYVQENLVSIAKLALEAEQRTLEFAFVKLPGLPKPPQTPRKVVQY